MKFQPDALEGTNTVTRREAGRIWVGAQGYAGSIVVPWRGAVLDWPVADVGALTAQALECVAALQPEVVILGTGQQLRFPAVQALRGLFERRIGVESMDTAAAVRTYNVLAAEGRTVVGAFIIGPPGR